MMAARYFSRHVGEAALLDAMPLSEFAEATHQTYRLPCVAHIFLDRGDGLSRVRVALTSASLMVPFRARIVRYRAELKVQRQYLPGEASNPTRSDQS